MFGIGMGPSSGETNAANTLSDISGFSTNQGEGDLTTGTNFFKDILSNPAAAMRVLAPQIAGITGQAQQQKLSAGQLGSRSGGTAAQIGMADTSTRSTVDNLIAQLTGAAASTLTNTGQNLLNTGVTSSNAAFNAANTIQQQNSAKWNDIFKSIASIAAAPFTGGASLGFGSFSMPGSGSGGNTMAAVAAGNSIPMATEEPAFTSTL